MGFHWDLPSGKHTENYGESPFLIGKSTTNGPCSIALAFVCLPKGKYTWMIQTWSKPFLPMFLSEPCPTYLEYLTLCIYIYMYYNILYMYIQYK